MAIAPPLTASPLLGWRAPRMRDISMRRPGAEREPITDDAWEPWLRRMFPAQCRAEFASHHRDLWDWGWRFDEEPPPFVAIWPRGGAKSSSAEMLCAAAAARGTRRFGLYVCETQAQADAHVGEVRSLLESPAFGASYVSVSSRLLGKFGQAAGWRADLLRTASGFSLLAVGLDRAVRGIKLGFVRPDLIIIDDIDSHTDSPAATEKKIGLLARAILPTRGPGCAVLAIQNLVHPTGVFARLARVEGAPAIDLLANRIVSGPIPAVRGLGYERTAGDQWRITSGEASWAGQDLAACEVLMNEWGPTAFGEEAQHEVGAPDGGMFGHLEWRHCRRDQVPRLLRTVVWCDPAVTSTDGSDAHGVQVDGIALDGTIYRLYSWEKRATPLEALQVAIRAALEYGADSVGIETDQGGDTWQSVYREACKSLGLVAGPVALEHAAKVGPNYNRIPRMRQAKAGSTGMAKAERASKMLADYEHGRIVHVEGTHAALERSLRRFPRVKPFDLVDAAFWSWADLRRGVASREPVRMEWVA